LDAQGKEQEQFLQLGGRKEQTVLAKLLLKVKKSSDQPIVDTVIDADDTVIDADKSIDDTSIVDTTTPTDDDGVNGYYGPDTYGREPKLFEGPLTLHEMDVFLNMEEDAVVAIHINKLLHQVLETELPGLTNGPGVPNL
jgi:hypothetical protein